MAIGYRIHKSGEGVGSILLGLYRADGELQMVGGAASFSVKDRLKLLADLEPLREGDEVREGDRRAAGTRRPTSAGFRCDPNGCCEVAYDQMEGNTVHGRRFPARGEVHALAAGPGTLELHVRPARRAVELRPPRRP